MRTFYNRWSDKLVLGVMTALALLLGAVSLSRLLYPFDVGHFEACVWTPSLMSAEGENPYQFALREPYVMAPYGYFYYLLVGVGLRLFGWQFWFGRAVTVLAAAVCAACVAVLARAVTADRRASMVGAAWFLSTITLFHWVGVHRPDLPALALAFVALTLVFTDGEGRDRVGPRSLLIIALLTLAVFFKQTTLFPIVVCAARYWQRGKIREALVVAGGVGVLILAVAWAVERGSNGGYFWQHFTLMRNTPHSYGDAARWVGSLLKSPSTWIAIVLICAAVLRRFNPSIFSSRVELKKWLRSPELLIGGYLISALGFAFVTSARRGAYINYYLEASAACAIAVAIAWRWVSSAGGGVTEKLSDPAAIKTAIGGSNRSLTLPVPSNTARPSRHPARDVWLCPVISILLLLAGGFEFSRMARAESYRWRSLPYYREIVATVAREVPAGELSVSVHPELILAAGRNYHFGDWIQYQDGRSAELREIWDRAIASRRYAAIIALSDHADLPGYRLAPMTLPAPGQYYPVFLYLRTGPKVDPRVAGK